MNAKESVRQPDAAQSQPVMDTKRPMTFEQRIGRLEEIVSYLERGNAPLADSLALFEEGTSLIAACSAELDQAEQKVIRLSKGPDGAPAEEPFAGGQEV